MKSPEPRPASSLAPQAPLSRPRPSEDPARGGDPPGGAGTSGAFGWPRSTTLKPWEHHGGAGSPLEQPDPKDHVASRTASLGKGVTIGELSPGSGIALQIVMGWGQITLDAQRPAEESVMSVTVQW